MLELNINFQYTKFLTGFEFVLKRNTLNLSTSNKFVWCICLLYFLLNFFFLKEIH